MANCWPCCVCAKTLRRPDGLNCPLPGVVMAVKNLQAQRRVVNRILEAAGAWESELEATNFWRDQGFRAWAQRNQYETHEKHQNFPDSYRVWPDAVVHKFIAIHVVLESCSWQRLLRPIRVVSNINVSLYSCGRCLILHIVDGWWDDANCQCGLEHVLTPWCSSSERVYLACLCARSPLCALTLRFSEGSLGDEGCLLKGFSILITSRFETHSVHSVVSTPHPRPLLLGGGGGSNSFL